MCLTIYIFMYGNLDFQIPQIMDSLIPFSKLASPFIINIRNHIQYSNAKIRARSTEYDWATRVEFYFEKQILIFFKYSVHTKQLNFCQMNIQSPHPYRPYQAYKLKITPHYLLNLVWCGRAHMLSEKKRSSLYKYNCTICLQKMTFNDIHNIGRLFQHH